MLIAVEMDAFSPQVCGKLVWGFQRPLNIVGMGQSAKLAALDQLCILLHGKMAAGPLGKTSSARHARGNATRPRLHALRLKQENFAGSQTGSFSFPGQDHIVLPIIGLASRRALGVTGQKFARRTPSPPSLHSLTLPLAFGTAVGLHRRGSCTTRSQLGSLSGNE